MFELDEAFQKAADSLFVDLFSLNASPLPTKSTMPSSQKEGIQRLLLQVVKTQGSLPPAGTDAVSFYFSRHVVVEQTYALRFEKPYGPSPRGAILEALAQRSIDLDQLIAHSLTEDLVQYGIDERGLQVDPGSILPPLSNR